MATIQTPISPKIKWGTIWGAIAGVAAAAVAAGAAAIDPHLFDSLGVWGPVIYGAVVLGAAQLAGYLKRDKLREVGQEALTSRTAKNYGAPATQFPAEEATAPASGATFGDPSSETVIQK